MILAASGALYKTVEIWSKTEYDAAHDGKKAKAPSVPVPGTFGRQAAASGLPFGGGSNPY